MVHQLDLLSADNIGTRPMSAPALVKVGGFHRAFFAKAVGTSDLPSPSKQSCGLIPPEVAAQNQDEAAWSAAGDVWCFGILIWKFCSRKEAIVRADAAFDYAFSTGLHEGISSLIKPPACTNGLWQLALRCLSTQPSDRPSMQEIVEYDFSTTVFPGSAEQTITTSLSSCMIQSKFEALQSKVGVHLEDKRYSTRSIGPQPKKEKEVKTKTQAEGFVHVSSNNKQTKNLKP